MIDGAKNVHLSIVNRSRDGWPKEWRGGWTAGGGGGVSVQAKND